MNGRRFLAAGIVIWIVLAGRVALAGDDSKSSGEMWKRMGPDMATVLVGAYMEGHKDGVREAYLEVGQIPPATSRSAQRFQGLDAPDVAKWVLQFYSNPANELIVFHIATNLAIAERSGVDISASLAYERRRAFEFYKSQQGQRGSPD